MAALTSGRMQDFLWRMRQVAARFFVIGFPIPDMSKTG
jgi:hypothetical protein